MSESVKPRRGPRLSLASLFGCALLLSALSANADSKRVLIRLPRSSDPVLDEAVIRLRGELAAMGFDADVTRDANATSPGDDDARGALRFDREGPWLHIQARGAATSPPVAQDLDSRRPEYNAEVVAVRAVELLRAVVTGFDKPIAEVASAPQPAVQPPPKVSAKPTPRALGSLVVDRGSFTLRTGPAVEYDLRAHQSDVGIELALGYGYWLCFAEIAGGTTLYRNRIERDEGQIDVRRSALLGRLGCGVPLSRQLGLFAAFASGLGHFQVRGHGETGYRGQRGDRDSALFQLGLGASAWLTHRVGAYLRLDAELASAAIAVRVAGQQIALLERPLLSASAGVVLRVP